MSPKMIVTKLNGGLGNQLFEYACARNLQLKYSDSLFLDIEGFRRSPRHYSLSNFVLDEDVRVLPLNKSRSLLFWQALSKTNEGLAFRIAKLFGVYLWKTPTYKEITIGDTNRKNLYLYGYWQSELYFKEHAEQIRKELRIKTDPTSESQLYLYEIQQSESVCVHIRRGDFVQHGLIVCDESYYLKGLDTILKLRPEAKCFIFTDDLAWVKENIHFPLPVTFVELEDPDYEILRLMYSCKHFIISNSSLSWWAQYLSDNPEKIVIAPSVWYPSGRGQRDRSIYLDNWTIL